MNNEVMFCYNYSASQNKEIQAIRNRYLPKEESKYDELKRLDRCVQSAGMIQALSIGVVGCLVFGLGMCLAMKAIGSSVGLGVFLGIIGTIVMIFAYPVYRMIFSKVKEKHRPRILELSAELCGVQGES